MLPGRIEQWEKLMCFYAPVMCKKSWQQCIRLQQWWANWMSMVDSCHLPGTSWHDMGLQYLLSAGHYESEVLRAPFMQQQRRAGESFCYARYVYALIIKSDFPIEWLSCFILFRLRKMQCVNFTCSPKVWSFQMEWDLTGYSAQCIQRTTGAHSSHLCLSAYWRSSFC